MSRRRSAMPTSGTRSGPAPILLMAYTSEVGGAERSTVEAAAALDRARFAPILAVPGEGPLAAQARGMGVEVVLDGTPHLARLGPFDWSRVVLRLKRVIEERDVALIHATTIWRITRAAALARLTKRPAICHVRDEHLATFASRRFRLAAREMERLVAISSSVMHELVASGFTPLEVPVLPNGIDPERFAEATGRERLRAEWDVAPEAPLVGLVGGIEPRKGQLELVRAAAHVRLARPDARFVIVGGDLHGTWGAYREALEREIAERELGGVVRLAGPRGDVPDVMKAIDLLVVPSKREPFGRVAVEAMGAGRPVVAYAVGGLVEIVAPGVTGTLSEPGDPWELAREIRRVIDDPAWAAELGRAGAQRVRERFSLARHVEGLQTIYGGILGGV